MNSLNMSVKTCRNEALKCVGLGPLCPWQHSPNAAGASFTLFTKVRIIF